MNQKQDIEPYWQDEDDWLSTVEFLPSNDPEGRVLADSRRKIYEWGIVDSGDHA